jgi:hypothetical protein
MTGRRAPHDRPTAAPVRGPEGPAGVWTPARGRTARPAGRVTGESGLTVAEVLIALAILLVGAVSLAALAPLSFGHIGQANFRTTAVFLAEQRLEQVKNSSWTCYPAYQDSLGLSSAPDAPPTVTTAVCAPPAPLSITGSTSTVTFPDEGYGAISGYPGYRRQVRIADCGVAPGCGGAVLDRGIRQVTVSVFYRPMTGSGMLSDSGEDVVRMTTLVAVRQ